MQQFNNPQYPPPPQQPYPQQWYNYPPQNAYPQTSPPPPKKRKWLWIYITVGVIGFIIFTAIGAAIEGGLNNTGQSATSSRPTTQPTQAPTPTATPMGLSNVKPTHGVPEIGGPISDFFGKYGTPTRIDGTDAFWVLNQDGSLSLDARDTGGGNVGYIAAVTPYSWSNDQTKNFCLAFAPQGYSPDPTSIPYTANGPFVYDSPGGKFALHLSSGSCDMNTL
jgi:hypothetical protein